jgi:2-oxoglutarate ferredoxin oxidoreductase subunit alpha
VVRYGAEDAEVGLITWGSTSGPAREAVEQAVREGLKVAQLHVRRLAPLPVDEIRDFAAPLRRVIVMELNAFGQLAHLIRAEACLEVEQLNKYTGLPFFPREVLEVLAGERMSVA